MFGAVGSDSFAEPACALLRRDGVDLQGVARVAASTGIALIHVDAHGENSITVIPGANALARAAQVDDVLLCPGRVLLMQLETPLIEVQSLARRARARGVRVILNAAPITPLPADVLASIDVLIVNESEAASLGASHGIDDPERYAEACNERHGPAVIITLGPRGALAFDRSEKLTVPAPSVAVVDSVGAGDAFTGAFAAALERGAPFGRAVREGVAAGALACTGAGAQAALPLRCSITALADTL